MFRRLWFNRRKVKSEITLAIDCLEGIDIKNLPSIYSSDMSILQIQSCCITIVEYIELLHKVINAFKYETMLYHYQLPLVIHPIYLRDFYLDKNKNYVNTETMTSEFINLSIEFLKLFESTERKGDKSFEVDKNLLLTQHILNNIILLASKGLSYE